MQNSFDILIIDDEKVIIDSITKIAVSEGFTVDYALNPDDAFQKLSNNNYSLIICDLMLPDKDGFEILNELEAKRIKIPMIMTTGYSTTDNAVKALSQGAVDFLPKPFTADELIGIIYRGIKYKGILESEEKNDVAVVYVPCPTKYLRLGYTSWLNFLQDGLVQIGVTDIFQKTVGDLTGIELMEINTHINQGTVCAKFKSGNDIVHNLLAPVSGKIIERNDDIEHDPSIVEKDPYFRGWLYNIIPTDLQFERDQLIPCSSGRI